MNYDEFVLKVSEMRKFQKEYFRYRAPDDLRKSKQFEKEVDAVIEEITGARPGEKKQNEHPTLF